MRKSTLVNLEDTLSISILCLLALYLGVHTAIHTPLMGDEALTLILGTLPTLTDLLSALRAGADSHGPIYHAFNWLYQGTNATTTCGFGLSAEIHSRLPSILFFTISFCLLYLLGRKTLPSSLSLILTLTVIYWPETLRHLAEVRSYGFMFLTITVASICLVNRGTGKKTLNSLLIGLSTMLGSLSHPLTGVYIGFAVLYTAASTWHENKRIDWSLLVSYILALVPFGFWLALGNSQVASTMAEGIRWERPPNIQELWEFIRPNYLLIIVCTLMCLLGKKKSKILSIKNRSLVIGMSFLTTSGLLWVASQWTNPLFLERYVLPMRLGWVLIAFGIAGSYQWTKDSVRIGWLGLLLILVLIIQQENPSRVTTGGFWSSNPWSEAGFGDQQYFKEKIPILCESSTTYLPRHFYFKKEREYILGLDKSRKSKEGNNSSLPSSKNIDHKMNIALKSVDERQNIEWIDDFLKRNQRFYLLNETIVDTDTKYIDTTRYKRTLLNPSPSISTQTLLIELIEKLDQEDGSLNNKN